MLATELSKSFFTAFPSSGSPHLGCPPQCLEASGTLQREGYSGNHRDAELFSEPGPPGDPGKRLEV